MGLNCSCGKKCLELSIYFSILLLLSPLEYKCWPSFELNWIPFTRKILCVNFGRIFPRFWRKHENSRFAHFYTNNFALIREKYNFSPMSPMGFRTKQTFC